MATVSKSTQWVSPASGKAMEIKVSITHEVNDKIGYADGYNVNLGKETYDSQEIRLVVDGKQTAFSRYAPNPITVLLTMDYKKLIAKGVYASLADIYIGEELYNVIIAVIADAEGDFAMDAEYIAIKAADAVKVARHEAASMAADVRYAQQIKNGLCPHCGTYCYGDCGR